MEEKGQFFLSEEFHLMNVEGMKEIAGHHGNNTVLMAEEESHSWMQILVGECLRRNKICTVVKDVPFKYLLITKEKDNNSTMGETWQEPL